MYYPYCPINYAIIINYYLNFDFFRNNASGEIAENRNE